MSLMLISPPLPALLQVEKKKHIAYSSSTKEQSQLQFNLPFLLSHSQCVMPQWNRSNCQFTKLPTMNFSQITFAPPHPPSDKAISPSLLLGACGTAVGCDNLVNSSCVDMGHLLWPGTVAWIEAFIIGDSRLYILILWYYCWQTPSDPSSPPERREGEQWGRRMGATDGGVRGVQEEWKETDSTETLRERREKKRGW